MVLWKLWHTVQWFLRFALLFNIFPVFLSLGAWAVALSALAGRRGGKKEQNESQRIVVLCAIIGGKSKNAHEKPYFSSNFGRRYNDWFVFSIFFLFSSLSRCLGRYMYWAWSWCCNNSRACDSACNNSRACAAVCSVKQFAAMVCQCVRSLHHEHTTHVNYQNERAPFAPSTV